MSYNGRQDTVLNTKAMANTREKHTGDISSIAVNYGINIAVEYATKGNANITRILREERTGDISGFFWLPLYLA